jgi:integrase
MAVFAECPACHRKQSNKNKKCKCGEDLDQAKRSKRVKYCIKYRLPGGKQCKELIGYSVEEARDEDSKKRIRKREDRLIPKSKMTFNELTKWYQELEKVKALASYDIIKINLNKFNSVFGDMKVSKIRPADLENYQAKRLKEGKAPATVDHEIGKAKTMVFKAFDNDLVGVSTWKAFRSVKKVLKHGSDVRDKILSLDEYKSLMNHSEGHIKAILTMGYYTGMRKGEVLNLTWDKIDLKNRMIRLEASDTKDHEARKIPICKELYEMLHSLPNRIQDSGKDSHVFQYQGKPISGEIRRGIKKACEDAGIKYGRFVKGGFIFHDLRHTFNTNMRKAGVAESVIMEITGHSTREMFDRYNTVDEDDARKAVDQLEVFFASGPQSGPQKKKKRKKEIEKGA